MTIEEYFGDWMKVIPKKEMLEALDNIKKLGKPICPMFQDIFKAFTMCSLRDLRIIFLGQDPYSDKYNGKPRATGILFGNNNEVDNNSLSPSLKVIKETVIDFEVPHNIITFDNSLERWAKQGILMINSALTCEMNKTGSHSMIWRPFTKKLLHNISVYDTAKVYVLFGEQAQTFEPYINKVGNHIISVRHPAYYARTNTKMPNIFREISNIIEGIEGIPIVWYLEED